MRLLKYGFSGEWVRKWQFFLIGQGYVTVRADGMFGEKTKQASIEFQKKNKLKPDGIIGQKTLTQAIILGLQIISDQDYKTEDKYNNPPPPSFPPIINSLQRQRFFGKFKYQILNDGGVYILDSWLEENIVNVLLPQLEKIDNSPVNNTIQFHKSATGQLKELFEAWEQEDLLHLIKTWNGSFIPRLIRGSSSRLSNHAFGIAFDINEKWNQLGIIPALDHEIGSVRKLVPIANKFGFYWGGHYRKRKEGMHFEIAKLL